MHNRISFPFSFLWLQFFKKQEQAFLTVSFKIKKKKGLLFSEVVNCEVMPGPAHHSPNESPVSPSCLPGQTASAKQDASVFGNPPPPTSQWSH